MSIMGNTVGTTYDKSKMGGLSGEQLEKFNAMATWFDNQSYEEMTVSLSPRNATLEIGSLVRKITFDWHFTKDVSNVTFNGVVVPNAPKDGSKELEISCSDPHHSTFECKVVGTRADGKGETAEATSTINFLNKYYLGYATEPNTINESFIKGLAHQGLTDTKRRSFTAECSSGQYIWYAYPKRLGTATFTMGNIGTGYFQPPIIVSVTNNSEYTEDYYVYQSINTGLRQSVEAT